MLRTSLLMLGIVLLCTRAEIIAYDCGDSNAEVSRVSLVDVKPCQDPRKDSEEKNFHIQLVQERSYSAVHVYECLVTVQQLITHCGMHSHASVVRGGLSRYVHHLGADTCREAHQFGKVDLSAIGAGMVSGLRDNSSLDISRTLFGEQTDSGYCNGVNYQQYMDVVVTAAITVRLQDYSAVADVQENRLRLRSGLVCKHSDKYCFDDAVGEVTWEPARADQCSAEGVDLLYEGTATLLTLNQTNAKYVIVDTNNTVFALQLTTSQNLCNQQSWRTEQNRLIVIFESSIGFFYQKTQLMTENTDIMAQVLTKLLFLNIAFERRNKGLVYDSIKARCHLREDILRNRITIAQESPDIVSNLVKEVVGYTGRVMGEVLYIVKCSPKIVEYRRAELCYQELPIFYQNQSRFMAPLTHIIQEHGTQIDCLEKLPVMFHLEGKWLELAPQVREVYHKPSVLDPNVEDDIITMTRISPISSNGVFTSDQMAAFQRTLLFPNERKAVLNLMTRRVTGATSDEHGFYLPNVFSNSELTQMSMNMAGRAWGVLSGLGNIFSVIVLTYVFLSFMSSLTSIVINYFSLKKASAERRSTYKMLLASLWGPLTTRFLATNQVPRPDPEIQTPLYDNVFNNRVLNLPGY